MERADCLLLSSWSMKVHMWKSLLTTWDGSGVCGSPKFVKVLKQSNPFLI